MGLEWSNSAFFGKHFMHNQKISLDSRYLIRVESGQMPFIAFDKLLSVAVLKLLSFSLSLSLSFLHPAAAALASIP
jgi:hypothetical protein